MERSVYFDTKALIRMFRFQAQTKDAGPNMIEDARNDHLCLEGWQQSSQCQIATKTRTIIVV